MTLSGSSLRVLIQRSIIPIPTRAGKGRIGSQQRGWLEQWEQAQGTAAHQGIGKSMRVTETLIKPGAHRCFVCQGCSSSPDTINILGSFHGRDKGL